MIKQIILRGVTSYSPIANLTIGPLTKVNMFYGHNGTGKSTIGNYLQDPGDLVYSNCDVQPPNPDRELVVYNHHFMENHFKEGSQPGVFTLNEGNIEAENALLAAEVELKKLGEQWQVERDAGKALAATQKANREALLDNLWALRKQHDSSSLKFCFAALNTKERLAEKVESLSLEPVSDTLDALALEAEELQSASDQEHPVLPSFSFPEQDVELSPLLKEAITGSENSYLSAIINELGNSDWIKQAFRFIDKNDDTCPFCQQKLKADFYDELGKVFDQTYQRRIEDLAALKDRYEAGAARLKVQYLRPGYQMMGFATGIAALEILLQKNCRLLADKLSNPSAPIVLESSVAIIDSLNALVKVEQDKTAAFNLKVKDKKAHLGKIKSRFWSCFRSASDPMLSKAKVVRDDLNIQIAAKRQSIELIKSQAQEQKQIIAENREKITNIDQSIDSINASLNTLGLKGFLVVKEQGDLPRYRLERPVQQQGVFKTLSEGEKTLISFLYFLEVCNGDLDSKSGKIKTNRVIVIDDPISSLSHNYVYDIASLIYRRVLSPKDRFKQVFILTHNLFFFHEMLKHLKKADDFSLFRITKAQYSSVISMKASDVQNDYQSFWQAIKDAQAGRTSVSVIPNMMRNILEHYFNFVHRQEELAKALQELADEDIEFKALYRYVNRESHSDAVNLTDFGEIEPGHYIERFRQVFVRTGFEQHYEKMMA
ncbi:AAA family ATPase [Pseudomonas aeruginosa]|uniref:AAA family ATPase n=1 Tax=Pseudomonas aeruginosa TaxID=287 RepID=UPI001A1B9CA5|nr:AAA family ATPase [Pseudomonas aeruginosa]MBG6257832.1 AAA family ATPase [Pseudomonas aeruginosa]MCT4830586.1 AAA family ATPase [Pseudomonas aeruginosa]MCV3976689.1 AAA family ATPase [Pseudomonas aeruginosa]MDH0232583.1 AAA family ATPase [Pseudomonas aeruginosa]MDI3571858.1 AAA family ATPase [Pseudomonas aeruginosa]